MKVKASEATWKHKDHRQRRKIDPQGYQIPEYSGPDPSLICTEPCKPNRIEKKSSMVTDFEFQVEFGV